MQNFKIDNPNEKAINCPANGCTARFIIWS